MAEHVNDVDAVNAFAGDGDDVIVSLRRTGEQEWTMYRINATLLVDMLYLLTKTHP